MSADLLAEFGDLAIGRAAQGSSSLAISAHDNGPVADTATLANDDDEDDGWGDFEVAQSPLSPSIEWLSDRPTAPQKREPEQASSSVAKKPARTRVFRASTLEILSNTLIDFGEPPVQRQSNPASARPAHGPSSLQRQRRNLNVLFDADEYCDSQGAGLTTIESGDADDFGDFQVGKPPIPRPGIPDLLSLDDPSTPEFPGHVLKKAVVMHGTGSTLQGTGFVPTPLTADTTRRGWQVALVTEPTELVRDPTVQAANERGGGLHANPPATSIFPVASLTSPMATRRLEGGTSGVAVAANKDAYSARGWSTTKGNDGENCVPSLSSSELLAALTPPTAQPAEHATGDRDSDWDWDATEEAAATDTENVAPNHVAESRQTDEATSETPPTNLPPPSVLLSLFPALLDAARTALQALTVTKASAVRERATSDTATERFLCGYLLAVTVAARVLAGRKLRWQRDPFLARGMTVSAAGARGMKLSSLDQFRTTREDGEAAELVAAWQQQAGRLRMAVALVQAATGQTPLRLPNITDTMRVQRLGAVPTARRACALCGLRRDERVVGVDFEVEDSFGEWWVEHWGHRACRSFWKEHEVKLRQR